MAKGLALAQVLLLIRHAATAPQSPLVHVELYHFLGCTYTPKLEIGVDSIKVDTDRGNVNLPNNKCVKAATTEIPFLFFEAFINLDAVQLGTGCTTTVFSDDACASQVAKSYYTASPNPPMCVGASAGIKSAKTVCNGQ